MGAVRRLFGRDTGETPEQYVRRLSWSATTPYVKPVLPSVIELYDRVAALEAHVAYLEGEIARLRSRGS